MYIEVIHTSGSLYFCFLSANSSLMVATFPTEDTPTTGMAEACLEVTSEAPTASGLTSEVPLAVSEL